VLYGVVLWATTSVLLLWLTASGLRAGADTANAVQKMTGGNTVVVDAAQTPEDRQATMQRAREAGVGGSWWAFAGILLSMVAAIGGALVGPIELTVRRDTRNYREQPNPVREQHTPVS
jgi:hypothetical protein